MRLLCPALMTLSLVAAPAVAQRLDTAAIESALLAEQREYGAPGVAIAIVMGDSVVYRKAVGVASVETQVPVTTGTLFRLGSTTKMFTGLTALLLAERGVLRLDDAIGGKAPALDPALAGLTLRQLLSHTAGLTDEGAGNGSHDDAALARRVESWTSDRFFAPPGDVYSYSSPGYWLAGHVLAKSADTVYADLVSHEILEPLGMSHSTFRPLQAMTYPLALDHRVAGGVATVLRPFMDDATTWPSGSLFSSADDLARFVRAMLNDGRLDGKQALPQSAVRRMYESQTPTPGGNCSYTLGLSSCPVAGVRRFSHYGFRLGTGSVITLIPARRAGVVILSNRNGGIFAGTEAKVLALLGLADSSDAPPPVRPLAPNEAAAFLGSWSHGADTIGFTSRNDSLVYTYAGRTFSTGGRSPGEVVIVEGGRPTQAFLLVTGKSGQRYLHDGLTAFKAARP
jgi:CubicO group peptidase (beta-lactamase class C family)